MMKKSLSLLFLAMCGFAGPLYAQQSFGICEIILAHSSIRKLINHAAPEEQILHIHENEGVMFYQSFSPEVYPDKTTCESIEKPLCKARLFQKIQEHPQYIPLIASGELIPFHRVTCTIGNDNRSPVNPETVWIPEPRRHKLDDDPNHGVAFREVEKLVKLLRELCNTIWQNRGKIAVGVMIAIGAILVGVLGIKIAEGAFTGLGAAEPFSIIFAMGAILGLIWNSGILTDDQKKRFEGYRASVEIEDRRDTTGLWAATGSSGDLEYKVEYDVNGREVRIYKNEQLILDVSIPWESPSGTH